MIILKIRNCFTRFIKMCLFFSECFKCLNKICLAEWLERLDYSSESHHKVVSSRLGFTMRRLENSLSVNPAVNGYLFQIRESQGSKRRGMGSAFHHLCPRYSGTLTSTATMAIRLWETFTFLLSFYPTLLCKFQPTFSPYFIFTKYSFSQKSRK